MKKLIYLFCLSLFSTCDLKPAFAQTDPLEYPPANISAIQQLQSFPVPRYKPGNTMLPNYNVMDPIYFGGYKQPGVSDATAIANSVTIQEEMCKNYKYMFNVNWFDGAYGQAAVTFANAHPEYKIAAMTLRAQVGGSKMWDQNFPNDHYLQDSQGRFLDWSGQITAYPYKVYRPIANFINEYAVDGDVIKNKYASVLSGLNRNVDFVNEDGETYPILENAALMADPVVTQQKNASGLGWQPFLARMIRLNDNAYSARFMNGKFAGATYTEYRLDGHADYQLAWSEARFINSPIKGQYYATGDLYVRWPHNWREWVSAWHGLKWVTQSRYYELAVGDKLFSPFVAAGWSSNPEEDVRPAQWLGLMKVMGMYGSEFYYTSYFVESLPAQDPKGYAWQAVIPPYSQAISSRYEDILRNGNLLTGDMIDNTHYAYGTNIPIPLYQFGTGDIKKVVVIRKHSTLNKYAITGTIQNSSNVINSTPINDEASINLNGQTLKFNIRRQGSTYIYDLTNPLEPVFYQLDGWHESSHPWYWSKDFDFAAPNFDASNGKIITYNFDGADYRSYQTVVALSNNQTASYSFTSREASDKYLFIKLNGSGTCSITFDALGETTSVINGWCKINLGNVSIGNHNLIIKAVGSLEFDSVSVTSNPNKYPISTCTTPSAIISPSDTSRCKGDTLLLSVSTNQSYLWSNGNTNQTIYVTSDGTYSCTVTTNGCSATSIPYTATFKTCSTCQAPTGLYNSAPERRYVYIYWNRVATADSGYTVYLKDITKLPFVDLPPLKKKQLKKSIIQIKATGLQPNHKYEYFIVANCSVQMDSEKSITPPPFTTKGNTLDKYSQR